LGEASLKKMEIGESFFGKNHGKLSMIDTLFPSLGNKNAP
jgi:hypothetical protein